MLAALLLTFTATLLMTSSVADDVISVETVSSDNDILYLSPSHHPDVFFADHFDDLAKFEKKWIRSKATKAGGVEESIAKYEGTWSLEAAKKDPLDGDLGLVMKDKAKHSAISAAFGKIFKFDDQPLVVQYELNFQNGQDCGGGYIKLLSHSSKMDLLQFADNTPYTIMFGPDKCGSESKLHFIFRHVNPKNQTIEEKHCKKLDTKERTQLEEVFKDKRPHLYRLIVRPDNSFEMSIDYKVVNYGTLVDDFEPPVNPPAEIDDPEDKKPEDWDEREKIPDGDAVKPDDWDETQPRQILDETAEMPDGWLADEPEMIPDEGATKPDDWDSDMDGDWEAPLVTNPLCESAPGCGPWQRPMIDNPAYKGKWFPPLINNPNYKGKWKPRKIPNPDYYHDPNPYRMTPIVGIGIELWSMSNDLYFDNLIVTDSIDIANDWAQETYDLKIQKLGLTEAGLLRRILNYSNQNPWLYAVYVVVVGLPLVLIITFCCSGPGSKPASESDPKKTDAIQDDDDPDQDEAVEERNEDVATETRSSPRRRKARKDL